MNLAELSIAVRERGIAEMYDLALLVCKRYWFPLTILCGLVYLPCIAINIALFYEGPSYNWSIPLLPYLVLLAEFPLISAASTLYLGNVLFQGHCSKRACLKSLVKHLRSLIITMPVKMMLLMSPAHMVEILVLEQLKGRRAWKRGMRLMSGWRQDYLAQLLINTCLFFLFMCLGVLLLQSAAELLLHADQPIATDLEEIIVQNSFVFDLRHSILGHFILFPLLVFFTVIRFLSYINLRTVREGWSTELQMKDAAHRLFGEQA